jgi:hypothetical protein
MQLTFEMRAMLCTPTGHLHACLRPDGDMRGDHASDCMQILYMHGNKISKLSDLKCLTKLPSLKNVTLHGNPVSELSRYRCFVAAQVPNLRSLNFGLITRLEMHSMEMWRLGKEKLTSLR